MTHDTDHLLARAVPPRLAHLAGAEAERRVVGFSAEPQPAGPSGLALALRQRRLNAGLLEGAEDPLASCRALFDAGRVHTEVGAGVRVRVRVRVRVSSSTPAESTPRLGLGLG